MVLKKILTLFTLFLFSINLSYANDNTQNKNQNISIEKLKQKDIFDLKVGMDKKEVLEKMETFEEYENILKHNNGKTKFSFFQKNDKNLDKVINIGVLFNKEEKAFLIFNETIFTKDSIINDVELVKGLSNKYRSLNQMKIIDNEKITYEEGVFNNKLINDFKYCSEIDSSIHNKEFISNIFLDSNNKINSLYNISLKLERSHLNEKIQNYFKNKNYLNNNKNCEFYLNYSVFLDSKIKNGKTIYTPTAFSIITFDPKLEDKEEIIENKNKTKIEF